MAGDWRGIPGNEHVFERLSAVMASGGAVAFVGAGASAGLYPLWPQLIQRLADEALAQGLASRADWNFWCDPKTKPQQAVQGIKKALGRGAYADALRRIFGRRTGRDGKSYTAVHDALMRLPFRGFVTTNYDLGLVDARGAVRPGALSGYATWRDADPVNRWLTEDIFREQPCPILFAHGVCERTDTIVLGADEYREGLMRPRPSRRSLTSSGANAASSSSASASPIPGSTSSPTPRSPELPPAVSRVRGTSP